MAEQAPVARRNSSLAGMGQTTMNSAVSSLDAIRANEALMPLTHVAAMRLKTVLVREKLNLVTVESLTAGMIASSLVDTSQPTNSVLYGGFVCYDTDAKRMMVGVSKDDVYCEDTAAEMAEGALTNTRAMVAVAVTGNAMPRPEHKHRLGEVYIGVSIRTPNSLYTVTTTAKHICTQPKLEACWKEMTESTPEVKYAPSELTSLLADNIRKNTVIAACDLTVKVIKDYVATGQGFGLLPPMDWDQHAGPPSWILAQRLPPQQDGGTIPSADADHIVASNDGVHGKDDGVCGQKMKHIHMSCLRPLLTTNSKFNCDHCNPGNTKFFPKGTLMWGCRRCDWDACEKCYRKHEEVLHAHDINLLIQLKFFLNRNFITTTDHAECGNKPTTVDMPCLSPFFAPNKFYNCDNCDPGKTRLFPKKTLLFGCRQCDWDVCEECFKKANPERHRRDIGTFIAVGVLKPATPGSTAGWRRKSSKSSNERLDPAANDGTWRPMSRRLSQRRSVSGATPTRGVRSPGTNPKRYSLGSRQSSVGAEWDDDDCRIVSEMFL
eukprot:m.313212 g.313212  ORF g.313212 m.313212 type:complete len:548 (+) comp20255_c0_seq3:277-1920(+)